MVRELVMMFVYYVFSLVIEFFLIVFKNIKRNIYDLLDKVSFFIYVIMVVVLLIGVIFVIFF